MVDIRDRRDELPADLREIVDRAYATGTPPREVVCMRCGLGMNRVFSSGLIGMHYDCRN